MKTTAYYTINEAGKSAIAEFVEMYANPGALPSGWYSDAEEERSGMDGGFTGIIEIGQFQSHDKIPHTLRLEREWFDAHPASE